MAVKCLAIMLKRAQQTQILDICNKLSGLIVDGTNALRDIYSICLKTLIADVPETMGQVVCDALTNKLIMGVERPAEEVITTSTTIKSY